MAYIKRVFVWDDGHYGDSGIDGWVPKTGKGAQFMTPGGGATVAHDTLEHFRLEGTIEDELEAFGAFFYGRLEHGNSASRDFAETLALDLASLRQDSATRLPKMLRTRPDAQASYFDECADDIVAKAVVAMRDQEDGDVHGPEYSREWASAAIHWMRRGYRLARKRWSNPEAWERGNGNYTAQAVFTGIEKEVDRITKYAADYLTSGITELRVLASPTRGNFSVALMMGGRVLPWDM